MDEPLPEMPTFERGSQTVFILHTSGSTSGSPKLVPCSARWLNTIVNKMYQLHPLRNSQEQDVCVSMYVFVCNLNNLIYSDFRFSGSMCHVAQESMLLGSTFNMGLAPFNQQLAFSTDELMDMIVRCRMNRLNQFAHSPFCKYPSCSTESKIP